MKRLLLVEIIAALVLSYLAGYSLAEKKTRRADRDMLDYATSLIQEQQENSMKVPSDRQGWQACEEQF